MCKCKRVHRTSGMSGLSRNLTVVWKESRTIEKDDPERAMLLHLVDGVPF